MAGQDIGLRLQELAQRQAAAKRIHSIVVGVESADGSIAATAVAGSADATGETPMSPDTPYYLASITKMYTATTVMKLAAARLVELGAPIAEYLPAGLIDGIHVIDGTDYSRRISVAQLLDQTSGLADYFEGKAKGGTSLVDDLKAGRDRSLTIEDIAGMVRSLEPKFAPGAGGGTKAHYSDTNYALLGAIIEAVTGSDIAHSFETMIFGPLGLTNTWVFDLERARPAPAVLFYKDRPVEIPLAMASFAPDGGVVSTASETLRFLRALFEGELLPPDQLAAMTARWNRIFFPLRYGSGLMRFKLSRWMSPFSAPPELVGHSGSTGSFAFYNPDRDVYLAGTVNQMDKPGRPFRLMTRMLSLLE